MTTQALRSTKKIDVIKNVFESTQERLAFILDSLGFTTDRWETGKEINKGKHGWLRVCIDSDDGTVEIYKFTASQVIEWEVKLPLNTPFRLIKSVIKACVHETN